MKADFLIIWMLGVSTLSVASPKPTGDTTRRTAVSGRITLLTSGLAPVPAVSYNNPVVDTYGSWTKGRLIFENFRGNMNGMYASILVSVEKKKTPFVFTATLVSPLV